VSDQVPSDQAPWRVRIALDPQDVRAIEAAMFAELPRERWELRLPRIEDEGSPNLLIDARPAKSRADSDIEAEQVYARARERAGLSAEPARIIGAVTPLFAGAPHDRLLNEADVLIELERFEWAVVRAQTACEMYARLALDQIARGLSEGGQKGSALFRKVWLLDRGDRALLTAITGVAIGDEDWWPSYKLHVERRNEVVHAGLSVSEHEALASIGAARSFIAFLQARWASPRPYRQPPTPGAQQAP
jgi:hypothetical protein